jgi:hypothetical protein
MKMLLWRAVALPGNTDQVEQFINTDLLRFFRARPGCLGMTFFQSGHQLQILSYWSLLQPALEMAQSDELFQLFAYMQSQQWLLTFTPAELTEINGGFVTDSALQSMQALHA